MIALKDSVTKENLLRAFAGECQAWRRYQLAANLAKTQKLEVLYNLFNYTSEQEKEHAEVFYNHLKEFTGQEISITADYPIDHSINLAELLQLAAHHEAAEHDSIYKGFGDKAREEGLLPIANSFELIAAVEKNHSQRFAYYANLMKTNKLFDNETPIDYLCLSCGHIHHGKSAPAMCPVCSHEQGFFIRRECSPFEC